MMGERGTVVGALQIGMLAAVVAVLSSSCGSQAGERPADTLAYSARSSHQSELALVDDEGANRRRLAVLTTTAAAADETRDELAWSPDGERLAFTPWSLHGSRNYVIEADGSGIRRIGSPGNPQWAPDGRSILIDCSWPGCTARHGITVAGATGLVERELGPGSGPAWSPDGRSVAFVRYVWRSYDGFGEPKANSSALYVVRRDGSGLRRIARSGGDVESTFASPVWSPDGTTVAFVASKVEDFKGLIGGSSLYTVRRDGSGLRRVVRQRRDELPIDALALASPVWLPDGKTILVLEPDIHYAYTLRAIALDGHQASTLTERVLSSVALHSNGDRVAVAREQEIEIIDLDDGRRTRLALPSEKYFDYDLFLKWSPDGEELAYEAYDALLQRELRVVNVDGSDDRRVTKPTEDVAAFDWRPSVDEG